MRHPLFRSGQISCAMLAGIGPAGFDLSQILSGAPQFALALCLEPDIMDTP